jgi:hypothetical protein
LSPICLSFLAMGRGSPRGHGVAPPALSEAVHGKYTGD